VPDPWPLIQQAVDSCASGDTVLVAPGHYHERLVIPDKTLTLASHALLTGDTLFIPQTILDGDSLGTVVTVETGGLHRFILDGFQIRGGVGQQWVGGGVHFTDSTDAELKRLHFANNVSEYSGVCVYADETDVTYRRPKSVFMKHIRVNNNSTNGFSNYLFVIGTTKSSRVLDVRVDEMTNSRLLHVGSSDSVYVSDVFIENVISNGTLISAGLHADTNLGFQEYRNITVQNCTWSLWNGGNFVHFGGFWPGIVKNVRFMGNTQVGNRSQTHRLLDLLFVGDPSHLDSLVFLRNRGVTSHSVVGEWESGHPLADPLNHGRVTNLIVEDCVLGDSTYTPWNASSNYPSMLTMSRFSLENARFVNNTVILTPGANTPEWGVREANVLRYQNYFVDSVAIKNVLFKDNLVVDLDVTDQIDPYWGNEGYCLMELTQEAQYYLMDNVVFDGNRQPNMARETASGLGADIGCVMLLRGLMNPNHENTKVFTNLVFRNNDEGNIRSEFESRLHFRNVLMLGTSRQGFDLEARSVTMENVWIDSCMAHEPLPFQSRQMPLRLKVTEPSVVRNMTISNGQTPYLVMPGYRPMDAPADPVVTFENCLFWNNEFTQMEADVPQDEWPGWNSFLPGIYRHCLLPEAMPLGENNLVDVDPLFDPMLDIPWLSPESPCIDTGTLDSLYQDAEDPANPGFALWPGQGGLRNDIGFTGGPQAAVFDTNWVALPRWEPRALPQDFSLGAPWPNPFNPTTNIALTLDRPGLVRLTVHNLLGQEVAVLQDGVIPAGTFLYHWNAAGQASGLYFITLQVDLDRTETRAVTLLR